MPKLEIQPFSEEHVEAAAELLAERHRAHRKAEPLLPDDLDPQAEVETLWKAEGASGAVALSGTRVVGYLLGNRRDEGLWGPNVWVEPAGHAVDAPETVRDLYGAAAERWVEERRTRHYALVPAADKELVDAWFRLSFGAQHASGIQEVPTGSKDSLPPDVRIRRAGPDDVEGLLAIDVVLPEHQRRSPVFGTAPVPSDDELRAGYIEELGDPEIATFIAEREGRPVASLLMVPVEKSSMHSGLARPARACLLAFAATIPKARGSGAGIALTNAGLAWAREQGYPVVVTDWRETNLLSSRFWPKRGFRRTFLRLYRSIP